MKKSTISQSSTKKVSSKKKTLSDRNIYTESFTSPYYEYRHMISREIIQADRTLARLLASKLIKEAESTDLLRIESFHLRHGISVEAWQAMCGLFEELKDALFLAKNLIGDRRLKLGLEKKYDANLASYALHQYHPDWRAAEDYHDARKTKIAADSSGKPGNTEIHVHMDQIPNSGIVPDKKKDDNE
jgi:hypothetical protein